MIQFKTCSNGHHYQDTYEECPYCPRPSPRPAPPTSPTEKTVAAGDAQPESGQPAFNADRTQIMSGSAMPDMPQPAAQAGTAAPAAGRTGANLRRLVGWLVTYDGHPNGLDFRVYEGRNAVGYEPGCEIRIDFDPAVSARHLTLLFRLGEFLFKDELSTNGTFLNGVLTSEGALRDGDELRVGNTSFLFRKSIR